MMEMNDKLLICIIMFIASAGDSWANEAYDQYVRQMQQALIQQERREAQAIEQQNQLIQQQQDYQRHYNYMKDQSEQKQRLIDSLWDDE
jgi:hypothetical protein